MLFIYGLFSPRELPEDEAVDGFTKLYQVYALPKFGPIVAHYVWAPCIAFGQMYYRLRDEAAYWAGEVWSKIK
jgi:hypothetical protein